ncbi:major capsid protein, partial [Parvimonas micra]|uniref:major capsid protein n=1 Tax=Parvimonas micra TaxID=33033 RepID=UPI002B4946A6
MVADVTAMIEKLAGPPNNMEGPFVMIVSRTVGARLGNDYKANGDKTIMQRLKDIPGISDIWMSSRLTGSQVLLVQLTSDVLRMING